MKKTSSRTQTLVECAVLVALGTVFSVIKIIQMPFGGSVTLVAMLPLVLIGYRHGFKWGMGSALVFSLIQMFLGFGTVSAAFLPGEDQMIWYLAILMTLLDYILAYCLVGISGLFTDRKHPTRSLCLGALTGTFLRYVCHFLSGYILWGSYGKWFFEEGIFDLSAWGTWAENLAGSISSGILSSFDGTGLALIYSLFYNGCYMIPEIILTVTAAAIISKIPTVRKELLS